MERTVLKASEGMILTNGEIYGKTIYLSEMADESEFKEISQEEYDEILNREAEQIEDMYRCRA